MRVIEEVWAEEPGVGVRLLYDEETCTLRFALTDGVSGVAQHEATVSDWRAKRLVLALAAIYLAGAVITEDTQ